MKRMYLIDGQAVCSDCLRHLARRDSSQLQTAPGKKRCSLCDESKLKRNLHVSSSR